MSKIFWTSSSAISVLVNEFLTANAYLFHVKRSAF
jgi:hypothetical protein